MAGRAGPGAHDLEHHGAELFEGELPLVVVDLDQLGELVVAGLGAAQVDPLHDQAGEFVAELLHLLGTCLVEVGAELSEAVLVGQGHAQELAQDGDGQREGGFLEEVELGLVRDGVEEFACDLGDPSPHALEAVHGEHPADEVAQPGVVRGFIERR